MAYIVRIDKPKNDRRGTHGWQVRGPGKLGYHSKMFSDGKLGGREQARAAAEVYKQEVDKLYRPRPRHAPVYQEKPFANNHSGVVGVFKSHQYSGRGIYQEYWGAFCPVGPAGGIFTKKFYIGDEQDEEEAFRLAVELRQMWEEAADQGKEAIRRFWAEFESGWL
ncbi:MAG: hypothetical protein AB1801_06530 [Chloroflexota bacterium]